MKSLKDFIKELNLFLNYFFKIYFIFFFKLKKLW